ncbi:MAG: amino acid synthesis family protein [Burkholderiaceae bacterium]
MIEKRRLFTQIETVYHEGGPAPDKPQKKGALAVVLTNPFAGRYEPELLAFMEALKPLGVEMAERLVAAMGCTVDQIEGYGKGAIVGAAGEIEHGALWHVPGGYGMRQILGWKDGELGGNAKAIVPSTKKVGGPGTRLDVPITHINASYVRGHFDAIEVGVPGHPRADELVYILAMTDGQRVHNRAGGLRPADIKGEDGLR